MLLYVLFSVCALNLIHASNFPELFNKGKLLHHVQTARVFKHDADFIKMQLLLENQLIVDKFDIFLNNTANQPSRKQVSKFVSDYFITGTSALENWVPTDWVPKPAFASEVYDSNLRDWILEVNNQWRFLGKRVGNKVKENQEQFSLIYVPYPFVIPGGRFTEFYYWDSYWIVEGLLLSEMYLSAQHMIRNFIYLVDKFGYVPNGGRSYYLDRSQPPFLIPMFNLYFQVTRDQDFLEDVIETLEKEFKFWIDHRSVTMELDGIEYEVFHYNSSSSEPRPEMYVHDITLGQNVSENSQPKFYSDIRTAAESGWDFSSRWFVNGSMRTSRFWDIDTVSIIPVCLNSLMGYNAKILSDLNFRLGRHTKGNQYLEMSHGMNRTLSRLFWSEQEGIWLDFNMKSQTLQSGFYPSSLVPLWTGMYGMERDRLYTIQRVVNYLERMNITAFPGGLPTSMIRSSQQWDLPNGWAPLHHMAILGLHEAGKVYPPAENLALDFAKKWILNCFHTYQSTSPSAMFEKYDVVNPGKPGGGGEYVVQTGFGWSNGVAMKLLSVYGHKIKIRESSDPAAVIVGVTLIIAALVTILSYAFRNKCSETSDEKSKLMLEMK